MKIIDLLESVNQGNHDLMDVMGKFLPFIVQEYKLKTLPKITFVDVVQDSEHPTFGRYENEERSITVAILNRHPLDILRTLAHELAHYIQGIENRLNSHSGDTGSKEENEAHERAGIAMRNFNKQHPEFFTDIKIPQSK